MSLDLDAHRRVGLLHAPNGRGAYAAAEHAVRFYDDDDDLLTALADFVGPALALGNAAIILATDTHRKGLAEALRRRGLDVDGLRRQGRLLERDAADVIAQIAPDGQLDDARFSDAMSDLIERAALSGKRVAIVGELVALLCAEQRHEDAVRLEELWNDLARAHTFSLLCAYPMSAFPRAADRASFVAICGEHGQVMPVDNLAPLHDTSERERAIAMLQQQAQALPHEALAREQAQALLQRREAELSNFIEEVPIALDWVGLDGTIVWANRAEYEWLGYTRAEYVGRNVAEVHADQDVAAEMLARLARQEALVDYAARLRGKDGSIRYARINATPYWENGELVHARCVTRDVTDQVLADEARARLAAIFDSSEDAIISKTLDGIITSWNHAAERLYGYTAEEIVGRPIATIVPEDRRAELADIMARLAQGERIAHHETVRVHKDGTRIEVSNSISPIHDRTGRIIGASKIARDIHERRALERQKQELVEMVAHDLGSPLTVIKGFAQILQRRQRYDERAVSKIVAETGRMGRLVNDLLEAARLEAGRLELRRAPVDLTILARDCAAQAALLAGRRRVRLEAPEQPVVGDWDGDRVEQILTNLLDNALKYAPHGDVTVRVAAVAEEAQVSVIDHGPGLTPEELERVFGHYFRSARTARKTAGTGLGLYICKGLVEAHGGRIWVDSVPGLGTTFAFALPYVAATPATTGF